MHPTVTDSGGGEGPAKKIPATFNPGLSECYMPEACRAASQCIYGCPHAEGASIDPLNLSGLKLYEESTGGYRIWVNGEQVGYGWEMKTRKGWQIKNDHRDEWERTVYGTVEEAAAELCSRKSRVRP